MSLSMFRTSFSSSLGFMLTLAVTIAMTSRPVAATTPAITDYSPTLGPVTNSHGVCPPPEALPTAYNDCFTKYGLQASAVFSKYLNSSGGAGTVSGIQEILLRDLYPKHGAALCTKNYSKAFENAVHCSYRIDYDCASREIRPSMPLPEDYARTVDVICANFKHMHFDCMLRKADDLEECFPHEARKIEDPNAAPEWKCSVLLIVARCAKTEYKTCGCTTSRVMSDMTYDVLMPSACDKDSRRVVCDPIDVESFVDDGVSGGYSAMAAPCLGVAVGLLLSAWISLFGFGG